MKSKRGGATKIPSDELRRRKQPCEVRAVL